MNQVATTEVVPPVPTTYFCCALGSARLLLKWLAGRAGTTETVTVRVTNFGDLAVIICRYWATTNLKKKTYW